MLEYHAAYYWDEKTRWYTAEILDFPGALSQGRTLLSARRMLRDALRTMIEWRLEEGKLLPRPNTRIKAKNPDFVETIRPRVRCESGAQS